jgi:hypothetical protein
LGKLVHYLVNRVNKQKGERDLHTLYYTVRPWFCDINSAIILSANGKKRMNRDPRHLSDTPTTGKVREKSGKKPRVLKKRGGHTEPEA